MRRKEKTSGTRVTITLTILNVIDVHELFTSHGRIFPAADWKFEVFHGRRHVEYRLEILHGLKSQTVEEKISQRSCRKRLDTLREGKY